MKGMEGVADAMASLLEPQTLVGHCRRRIIARCDGGDLTEIARCLDTIDRQLRKQLDIVEMARGRLFAGSGERLGRDGKLPWQLDWHEDGQRRAREAASRAETHGDDGPAGQKSVSGAASEDRPTVGSLVELWRRQWALEDEERALKEKLIEEHGGDLFLSMLRDVTLGGSA